MVNSNSKSTRMHEDHDDEAESHLIVKIKPRVRVKKAASRVRVKKAPSTKWIKSHNGQEPSSDSSWDSLTESSLHNDDISLDENSLEDIDVAEIISLLERARLRSHGNPENDEHFPESINNTKITMTKLKRKKKYY